MKNYKDFKELLLHKYEEDTEDIVGIKYISWSKLKKEDKDNLKKVFSLSIENKDSVGPCLGNYWAEDYPIDFKVYPNSCCDVYKDKQGKNYYLVYLEYGGHAPEERCRLIQKKLIKFDSLEA